MNSKRIGNIAEAKVMAEFITLGLPVLIPFGDNERYDLVIEVNKRFYKVQVKTGNYKKNGSIIIPTCSSYKHRGIGKRSYTKNQIDFIAVYCLEVDKCYLISNFEECATGLTLRVKPTKNNQNTNIRWAKDYLLKPCVETLQETP